MGRPTGHRNADFEQTRKTLLESLHRRLVQPDGARASVRELAAAAGVSVPTLRHYFGDREGIVRALLEDVHRHGEPYLLMVATGPLSDLRSSIAWFLRYLDEGFLHGVAELHALGLGAGLRDDTLGPLYLEELVEPTLKAVEARLARHLAAGHLRPCDLRAAALSLVAPALFANLHQRALGGAATRPLSLALLIEEQTEAFVRAYAA